MVEFAGYDMPVQYFGILEEHINCRENASVFDVSHMGQVRIHGKDRVEFIESLCCGDIKELKTGSATLSLFTNEKGGIRDDTIITNMNDFL
jgi:aminomethyltransferase